MLLWIEHIVTQCCFINCKYFYVKIVYLLFYNIRLSKYEKLSVQTFFIDQRCNLTVHPQNVRFQNVRFQNVRFQNVWNVRFTKRQVYKTSCLQNVRFTKRQDFKTSGLQKKHPYIFCTCGLCKSAGLVAAMLAGKVMAVFYSLFERVFFAIYHHNC